MRKACLWIAKAFGLVEVAVVVWFICSSAEASTVYVLRGGDPTSDAASIDALTARGHLVTSGVESAEWDGTQADLSQYAVVLVLNNFNWSSSIPAPGRAALVDYVGGGGSLVTSEWLNYSVTCVHSYVELDVVMPVVCVAFNYVSSTDYIQATTDPIIDEGLPSSFSFNLVNIGGTEASFDPKDGAVVFFSSSNGGGRPGSAGLVGWDVLGGRVISYSTLVTDTELASAEYTQLLGNAVNWAARVTK